MPRRHKLQVSVVIPTLNEEKYLPHLLAALKAQKGFYWGEDFEVIVADGHSKDRTIPIAHSFGCRTVFEHVRTISAGRNAGANVAKGDIVVFTDADAVPPETWLLHLWTAFEDKRVAAAFGGLDAWDGTWFETLFARTFGWLFFYLTARVGLPSAAGSNLAIRRRILKKIGGFNVKLVTGEDVDVQKRARKYGRVSYINKAWTRVSMRRIRNWGYLRYILFHLANFVRIHAKASGYEEYEAVR